MKINSKIKIMGLAFLVGTFAACDTADQEVSPMVSPLDKPMVTFTTDFTGDATEGDIITYNITFDKPIERSVTFTAVPVDGSADDHDYFSEPVVLAPYTKSADLDIQVLADGFPEFAEDVSFDISILGIADKFLVHPDVAFPTFNVAVANYNDPTLLSIGFGWDNDLDMDMVTWSDTPTYPMEPWGTEGAGSGNPEVDHSIWLSDPVGTYYVSLLDWWEGVAFNYTFTLGYPDGTVELIEGSFDPEGTYAEDVWLESWGSPIAYRLLKVVVDGTSFVVTAL